MGVQKNATYKVHNGTDWDEINFKTNASQVKMASGVDLESGFSNSKDMNGYTKMPNGMIRQWGKTVIRLYSGQKTTVNINFPISFTKDVYSRGSEVAFNKTTQNNAWCTTINSVITISGLGGAIIEIQDLKALDQSYEFEVFWFAEGY